MVSIAAFTKTNDAIAVLTPVYGAFDASASDAKRPIIAVPMNRNEDNRYSVDYSAFEAAIIKHDVKVFIHCNPHNPVGHVWTEERWTSYLAFVSVAGYSSLAMKFIKTLLQALFLLPLP